MAAVLRLDDDQAFQTFKECRWEGGEPHCPKCGCVDVYTYTARRLFKCKGCASQFSVTSGTLFAGRKLAMRDYLAAIALFVNGAKGVSMLQISRDLNVQYKTAFVLCHKLREAMGSPQLTLELGGTVEIDGAYFGGTIRQENKVSERVDRRLKRHQSGKRRAVVVLRERGGRTLTTIVKHESDALPFVVDRIKAGSKVFADEGTAWDGLHDKFDARRINHSVAFSDEGVCTNQAESFFSRLRRAELGVHHHFSPQYLHQYAAEMAWREDHRRKPNGAQFDCVTKLALAHPVSRNWCGYWQRADI